MKKNLKGFTLIELIIVIALFAMLLAMISGLFKPIAQLFATAKETHSVSSSVDGISEYVCGNLRYATKAKAYINYDELTNVQITAFMNSAGLDLTSPTDRKKVQIIYIYNDDVAGHCDKWTVSDDPYVGRMYRRKGIDAPPFEALGIGYYGRQDYKITLADRNGNLTTSGTQFRISVEPKRHDDLTKADGSGLYGGVSMLNTSLEVDENPAASSGDVNSFILFTLPD